MRWTGSGALLTQADRFVLAAARAAIPGASSPEGAAAGAAPGFPVKPVRIVIGFTPGGVPDITARYIAQKLSESWKQQVIVDNRAGAGGAIAAQNVASATRTSLPL